MSDHRRREWDRRANYYRTLALRNGPDDKRPTQEEYRAQFKRKEFDKALERTKQ